MSSLFISNCFIKTVTSTDNSISGTAIYRTAIGNFWELTFKGFFSDSKDNDDIVNFNEKSLVVLIGRFALEDKVKYVIKHNSIFSNFFKFFVHII